jgi:hypothetical protein
VNIYPVALEPLAIIVNKSNPLDGLTLRQVRGIFAGTITNWKEVGGRNEKIAVITQLHCTDYTPNWKGILDDPGKFTKKRVDVKAQPEMAKTVSDYKQAIGHLEMTSVMESKAPVKILAIDGALPTSENMKKGRYPFWPPCGRHERGGRRQGRHVHPVPEDQLQGQGSHGEIRNVPDPVAMPLRKLKYSKKIQVLFVPVFALMAIGLLIVYEISVNGLRVEHTERLLRTAHLIDDQLKKTEQEMMKLVHLFQTNRTVTEYLYISTVLGGDRGPSRT